MLYLASFFPAVFAFNSSIRDIGSIYIDRQAIIACLRPETIEGFNNTYPDLQANALNFDAIYLDKTGAVAVVGLEVVADTAVEGFEGVLVEV